MVARVSTYAGPAEGLDELARGFEQSGDAVRVLDGFEGTYLLVDSAGAARSRWRFGPLRRQGRPSPVGREIQRRIGG
jgi:hypothetical protein